MTRPCELIVAQPSGANDTVTCRVTSEVTPFSSVAITISCSELSGEPSVTDSGNTLSFAAAGGDPCTVAEIISTDKLPTKVKMTADQINLPRADSP